MCVLILVEQEAGLCVVVAGSILSFFFSENGQPFWGRMRLLCYGRRFDFLVRFAIAARATELLKEKITSITQARRLTFPVLFLSSRWRMVATTPTGRGSRPTGSSGGYAEGAGARDHRHATRSPLHGFFSRGEELAGQGLAMYWRSEPGSSEPGSSEPGSVERL